MIGAAGWSAIEWLTMTGWKLELGGDEGTVTGAARKEIRGDVVVVSGGAQTVDDLGWTLLEQATQALERADGHSVAVARATA